MKLEGREGERGSPDAIAREYREGKGRGNICALNYFTDLVDRYGL